MSIPEIDAVRRALVALRKNEISGRYRRRANSAEATRRLIELGSRVDDVLELNPDDPQALDLRALLFENLLDFENAILCLQRVADTAGKPDRKLLKRIAALKAEQDFWEALGLTPFQLEQLAQYLSERYPRFGETDDPFRFTREWLANNYASDWMFVLDALPALGANNDSQVLANVCDG